MINSYYFVDPDPDIGSGFGRSGCYICFSETFGVDILKPKNRVVFNRQSAAINKLYSNRLTRNVCYKEFGDGFFTNNDDISLLEKFYYYKSANNMGRTYKTPNSVTNVVHTSFLSKTYAESLNLCRILLHVYGVLSYSSILDAIFY